MLQLLLLDEEEATDGAASSGDLSPAQDAEAHCGSAASCWAHRRCAPLASARLIAAAGPCLLAAADLIVRIVRWEQVGEAAGQWCAGGEDLRAGGHD